jgi:hypothetical protein
METTQQTDGCTKLNRLLWRVFEGFGSLLGVVCSLGVLYLRFKEPAEQDSWRERIASAISWEFFIALLIASCLGLIWAVAAPKWLEKLCGKRALIAIGFLLLWIIVGTLLGVR